jgi:hypothetical protein
MTPGKKFQKRRICSTLDDSEQDHSGDFRISESSTLTFERHRGLAPVFQDKTRYLPEITPVAGDEGAADC